MTPKGTGPNARSRCSDQSDFNAEKEDLETDVFAH